MGRHTRERHALIRWAPALGLIGLGALIPVALLDDGAEAVGSAGVPVPPTIVWSEDFSGAISGSGYAGLDTYVGAGMVTPYRTDSFWAPSAHACNGWILSASSAMPSETTAAGCHANGGKDYTNSTGGHIANAANVVANGTGRYAWSFLQYQAYVLGLAQQMTEAQALTNAAVAAETNGTPAPGVSGTLQFAADNVVEAEVGHYYIASAYFAAMHCREEATSWSDPSQSLNLRVNGVIRPIVAGLNPCNVASGLDLPGFNPYPSTHTAPFSAPNAAGGADAAAGKWYPGPVEVVTVSESTMSTIGGTAYQVTNADAASGPVMLGLEIHNLVATTTGNDIAFDLPAIQDATPHLFKSFVPSTVEAGTPSTLMITVTNTTDLLAKQGWSFTDSLPDGLVVAPDPRVVTTCAQGTVTAEPGADIVTVSGDLNGGDASCLVEVDVVADAGIYVNGIDNMTTTYGVVGPDDPATLIVTPEATKDVDATTSATAVLTGDASMSGMPGYVTYTISTDLPKIAGLASLTVRDAFTGLAPLADAPPPVVTLVDVEQGTTTPLGFGFTYDASGLTVTVGADGDSGGPDALGALVEAASHGGVRLVVTFVAAPVLDGVVANTASLSATSAELPEMTWATNEVDVGYGGIDLLKTDSVTGGAVPGATFAIYRTEAAARAAIAARDAGTPLSSDDGRLTLATGTGGAPATEFTTDSEGLAHLSGLRFDGGAVPSFWLVELVAPEHYALAAGPWEVTASGPCDGTVDVAVENTPTLAPFVLTMPFTGAGPQFPFVVAGMVVLFAGATGVLAWRSPRARAAVAQIVARFRPTGGGAR